MQKIIEELLKKIMDKETFPTPEDPGEVNLNSIEIVNSYIREADSNSFNLEFYIVFKFQIPKRDETKFGLASIRFMNDAVESMSKTFSKNDIKPINYNLVQSGNDTRDIYKKIERISEVFEDIKQVDIAKC